MKSLNDLIKASEELAKPVLHHELESRIHTFHLPDENVHYEYVLSDGGRTSKNVKCPECSARFESEGIPGETVHVECPKCGKKGSVEL